MRVLCFLAILTTALAGPFWVAVLLGCVYAVCYQGVELVPVALIVDVYFGYGGVAVPYVTLATAAVLVVVIALRPHLNLYTE